MSEKETDSGAVAPAVQILQKCIGDVTDDAQEHDIDAFTRWAHCDCALELRGNKLWLFSVKVSESA